MVKMVDMPVEYLLWVLAQDKEDYRVPTLEDYTREEIAESGAEAILGVIGSLQVAYDEFADFRAWVLGVLGEDGRVMIREDMLFSDPDEWQEIVDSEWAEARQELVDGETTTTGPLGTHTYVLSTYLSMLYQYAAPVRTFWGI